MSNENDCVFMLGRYPEGTHLPSATDESKSISVGGMQICALNAHNIRAMISYIEQCSDTKDGKLDLLEALDVYAQNNLECGMSSPVIAEIWEAWNRVFYS
jgi:hypothetical protein